MNARLVDAVLENVRGSARVLELHAGIGNFSLPLAAAGHSVRATELNPRASTLAAENARAAGLVIDTVALPDAKAVRDAHAFDVVVLDPPRAGARDAVQALATSRPKRIVYVSCDPATLARDVPHSHERRLRAGQSRRLRYVSADHRTSRVSRCSRGPHGNLCVSSPRCSGLHSFSFSRRQSRLPDVLPAFDGVDKCAHALFLRHPLAP